MEGNRGEALPKCPNYKILLYSHTFSLSFTIDSCPRGSHDPPPPHTRTRVHTHRHRHRHTGPRGMGGIEGKRFQSVQIIKYYSTHMHAPFASPVTPTQWVLVTPRPYTHTHTHTHTQTHRHTGPRETEGNRGKALLKGPTYKILLYSHACWVPTCLKYVSIALKEKPRVIVEVPEVPEFPEVRSQGNGKRRVGRSLYPPNCYSTDLFYTHVSKGRLYRSLWGPCWVPLCPHCTPGRAPPLHLSDGTNSWIVGKQRARHSLRVDDIPDCL
jgi:hypothetical protein